MPIPAAEVGTPPTAAERWQRVESLTQAMLAAAEAADIERLTTLEAERSPLIRGLFTTDGQPPPAEKLRHLMTLDAEISRRAGLLRDALLQRLGSVAKTRKAVAAYGEHQP